jgi:hypothetical protein
MTNENKKTSYQLIFVHIFRKKQFKDNLENFMSESLNATSTPLRFLGQCYSDENQISIIHMQIFRGLLPVMTHELRVYEHCSTKNI